MKHQMIVYIAGSGRSGSTLLDLLLSNHPQIESVGELSLLGEYWHRKKGVCICGQHLSKCDFWGEVEKKTGLNFSSVITNVGYSRIIRGILNNVLPYLNLQIKYFKKSFKAYENIWKIYNTISELTDKPIISDSSKNALNFKYYWLHNPDKIKIILLHRDGRGVVNSLLKHGVPSVRQATKIWINYVTRMKRMAKKIPTEKKINLKYEDFCRNPEEQLKLILNFLELDYSDVEDLLILSKAGKHVVAGSPTIKNDKTFNSKIVLDEKWKNNLDNTQLNEFYKYGGKINIELGYH